jgi:hypothetical protein
MGRYEDPNEVIDTEPGRITVGEIKARVRLAEPGIVVMRELARSSLGTFEVFMETSRELAAPFKRFALVNDLREATHRPRGAYHDAIIKAATTIGVHWAIVLPGGVLVRTISRFIMGRLLREGVRMGVTWSLHDNTDAAVAAARAALTKAGGP